MVINKVRNLRKPNEAGPSTSNIRQIPPEDDNFEMETPGLA